MRRQPIGADDPTRDALYSPTFSPLGPSGFPVFSTKIAITLSWPAARIPDGHVNVCVCAPAAEPEPRNAPFSHTEYAPVGAIPSTVSVAPVSDPVAVKCPRYQTYMW